MGTDRLIGLYVDALLMAWLRVLAQDIITHKLLPISLPLSLSHSLSQ